MTDIPDLGEVDHGGDINWGEFDRTVTGASHDLNANRMIAQAEEEQRIKDEFGEVEGGYNLLMASAAFLKNLRDRPGGIERMNEVVQKLFNGWVPVLWIKGEESKRYSGPAYTLNFIIPDGEEDEENGAAVAILEHGTQYGDTFRVVLPKEGDPHVLVSRGQHFKVTYRDGEGSGGHFVDVSNRPVTLTQPTLDQYAAYVKKTWREDEAISGEDLAMFAYSHIGRDSKWTDNQRDSVQAIVDGIQGSLSDRTTPLDE